MASSFARPATAVVLPAAACVLASLLAFAIAPGYSFLVVLAAMALLLTGIPIAMLVVFGIRRGRAASPNAAAWSLIAGWLVAYLISPFAYLLLDGFLYLVLTGPMGVRMTGHVDTVMDGRFYFTWLGLAVIPAVVAVISALFVSLRRRRSHSKAEAGQ
jgi:hypothetical protein